MKVKLKRKEKKNKLETEIEEEDTENSDPGKDVEIGKSPDEANIKKNSKCGNYRKIIG